MLPAVALGALLLAPHRRHRGSERYRAGSNPKSKAENPKYRCLEGLPRRPRLCSARPAQHRVRGGEDPRSSSPSSPASGASSSSGSSARSPSGRRSTRAPSAPPSATASASRRSSTRAGPTITSPPISTCPTASRPFPGVLVPCGHSDNGKAAEAYQRARILLAKNGLAVLCYDPIGQGERMQLLDEHGKPASTAARPSTRWSASALLLVGRAPPPIASGTASAASTTSQPRPKIDPKRLGCTGNSGGGTLTAYLMALDDRIACAAPSCYITSLERLFATIGPQDAEQNITGQVAFGMEHADYLTLRAPKPTLIACGTQDFFDIGGTWTDLPRGEADLRHASATASASTCSSTTTSTASPSRAARRRPAGCAAGCSAKTMWSPSSAFPVMADADAPVHPRRAG